MPLSLRCNLRERKLEWRGGVISWQKLLSALSPWGGNNVPLSPPPLAKAARDTKGEEVRGEKKEGKKEKEKEKVRTLGTHPSPLFSFRQTSYLTQLITHLITVSA